MIRGRADYGRLASLAYLRRMAERAAQYAHCRTKHAWRPAPGQAGSGQASISGRGRGDLPTSSSLFRQSSVSVASGSEFRVHSYHAASPEAQLTLDRLRCVRISGLPGLEQLQTACARHGARSVMGPDQPRYAWYGSHLHLPLKRRVIHSLYGRGLWICHEKSCG